MLKHGCKLDSRKTQSRGLCSLPITGTMCGCQTIEAPDIVIPMTGTESGQSKSDGTFLLPRWVSMTNRLSSRRLFMRQAKISWLILDMVRELHNYFMPWPKVQTTTLIVSTALLVSRQYMNTNSFQKKCLILMMYGSNSLKPSMKTFLVACSRLEFTLLAEKDS